MLSEVLLLWVLLVVRGVHTTVDSSARRVVHTRLAEFQGKVGAHRRTLSSGKLDLEMADGGLERVNLSTFVEASGAFCRESAQLAGRIKDGAAEKLASRFQGGVVRCEGRQGNALLSEKASQGEGEETQEGQDNPEWASDGEKRRKKKGEEGEEEDDQSQEIHLGLICRGERA